MDELGTIRRVFATTPPVYRKGSCRTHSSSAIASLWMLLEQVLLYHFSTFSSQMINMESVKNDEGLMKVDEGFPCFQDLCLTTIVYIVIAISPSPTAKAMHFVDVKTREKLANAKDSDEIVKILNGPFTRWQTTAPCLRHTKNCQLRVGVDVDSERLDSKGVV